MARDRLYPPTAIGTRIKQLRGEKPQQRLASESGVSRVSIAKIESGKTARPDIRTIERLAPYLGCRADDLIALLRTSAPGADRRRAKRSA